MTTKHTPATPLPCRVAKMEGGRKIGVVNALGGLLFYMDARSDGQAAYFVRAANAYPRLVEALRNLRAHAISSERGHIQPGSLLDQESAALLAELGE